MPPTVFAGGEAGAWEVESVDPVTGPSLPMVPRLAVVEDSAGAGNLDAAWMLRGRTSNSRYTRRDEQETLSARQAGLGRPQATRAALIPITKSSAWWALAQNERRELLEGTSHHIASGMQAVPACGGPPALPRPGSERALRLPHLVRVRPPRRASVRGARGPAPRHPEVGLRGTRSRHPPRTLRLRFCGGR